jgi:hypothetical protein
MIERVARALFEHDQPDHAHFPGSGGWDGPLLNDTGRNYWRGVAIAAIEAMREPGCEILSAVDIPVGGDYWSPKECWQTMIDKALGVDTPSEITPNQPSS